MVCSFRIYTVRNRKLTVSIVPCVQVLDMSRNPLTSACTLASVSFVPTLLLQGTPLHAFTRQDEVWEQDLCLPHEWANTSLQVPTIEFESWF